MDEKEFDFLEVKPKSAGIYFVTICQHHTQYVKDILKYDGDSWVYNAYDSSYVCFIHKKIMNS